MAGGDGRAQVDIEDHLVSLTGLNTVLKRAIVVHQGINGCQAFIHFQIDPFNEDEDENNDDNNDDDDLLQARMTSASGARMTV